MDFAKRALRESPSLEDVALEHDLTAAEVREALRLTTPALVAEVMLQARALIAEEIVRHARIDTKASFLLGAIGVAISVTTAIACQFAASCSHLKADFCRVMQPPHLQTDAATSTRG